MTDDRLPWFPCNPNLLLGALASMGSCKGYTYVTILLRIYEVRGPIHDTAEDIANRTKFPEADTQAAIDKLLLEKRLVRRADGALMNSKAAMVIEHGHEVFTKRSSAGTKNAKKRWKADADMLPLDAKRMPNVCQSDADPVPSDAHLHLHKQEQVEDKDSKTLTVKIAAWPDDAFDHFWAIAPRRVGKAAAQKAFERVRRAGKVPWPVFLEGTKRWAYTSQNHEPKYIKHPATWINAGCWDDEIPPPGPVNSGPPRPGGRGPSAMDIAMGRDRGSHE